MTMFSSVSQKIISLYQKDYAPQNSSLIQNDRFPASNSPSQAPNQFVIKGDQNFTDGIGSRLPGFITTGLAFWPIPAAFGRPAFADGGPLANARDQLFMPTKFAPVNRTPSGRLF